MTHFAAVLDAERIKLTTLRSPLWATAAAALLSFAVAALQAAASYRGLTVTSAALGVAVFGVPVLMVVAAMTVTGEYRTGLMRTTLMAAPNRTAVLGAKAVVAALFCGGAAALMTIGAVLVGRADGPGLWRATGAIGLYAALSAVLGVAVAALVRHTAGAVTVLLLWPLLVEPLLGNLPGHGARIGPYLPFANALRFLDVSWLFPAYDMPWGEWGSLGYFAAVVAAVFVVAVGTMNRRDA
ncbi:ABC transporter permease [Mycolicibacterium poriferae]|jgi:ABC-2 type transport system permease protein|uniref:ABC transporter permease n=1 Tax=Mycolicibacterium poriferae TaxID=39694 RepID=A0A6N4V6K8_9MYCO|nr:ABC transporter permease [Mycolicibacterium poriferae]MCV7263838.1 ABC transporter permease [Mycolicibacterium poriferae]QFS89616.1 ABC-2 family transporter protein [Mycobacterium sp. THAF192]BBX50029.1 ABC transporter permease [Mycolicibacterium poriferae]